MDLTALAWWRPPGFCPWLTTLTTDHPAELSAGGLTLESWDKSAKLKAFNWGITNFDTFFSACLVVFQSITLEGWVDIIYMTTDASCSFYSFLYLLAVVFIRAFILMNVTLTVAIEELKGSWRHRHRGASPAAHVLEGQITRCQVCSIRSSVTLMVL